MQTEWNLSALAKSDDDPALVEKRKETERIAKAFIQKWKENSFYLEKPEVLRQALDEFEKIENLFGDGGGDEEYYFWLRSQIDQANSAIKAKLNQIGDFSKEISNQLRFFTSRLSKVSPDIQKVFLNSPELKDYRHFLERLFRKGQYILEEKEENLLSLKSSVAYENWKKMISTLLAKEERVIHGEKKNFSEISSLISHTDKKIRDEAANALNDILRKYLEVAEYEINSVAQDKKINDSLRNMPRPDFSRHLKDDIESEIVDSLVEAVSERNDLAQRFYKLKAKLFGVPKLEYHERNVPYGKIEKEYSYQDSIALVEKVFRSLDPQFAKIFQGFVQNGQIDAFPKAGKRSGAFCVWWSPSKPVFVMLNHTNRLKDVLTIAHEFGHAINAELSKKQNALQFNTPTSTSETASTFMEDFVLKEILAHADDELKLTIYMEKLNGDISTIFRQVACYKFEQSLHSEFRKEGYLSAEKIGGIFQNHMIAYMGPAVEQSPGAENWWISWPHIREYFYTYSYASGLLISKALQNKVNKNPAFTKEVKEFLAAGTSASPKKIFAGLGLDITKKEFWFSGLSEIESLLDETEKLATKLKN